MAVSTSECAEVNRIYMKSIKQVLIRWNHLSVMRCAIWYHLYVKKREKHPWRSVTNNPPWALFTFVKLKITLFHGCFSCILNCANGTKSRNRSHLYDVEYKRKPQTPNLCHLLWEATLY